MNVKMADDLETTNETTALDDSLIIAVRSAEEANVKRLLDSGANVKCVNTFGNTPLHYAAGINHIPIATLLLKAGADPHLKNIINESPLDIARSSQFGEMEEVLQANISGRSFQAKLFRDDSGTRRIR